MEHEAHHGHDGERAREVGSALEPSLGGRRLGPQHTVEVHPLGVRQRVLEHLHLVRVRVRIRVGVRVRVRVGIGVRVGVRVRVRVRVRDTFCMSDRLSRSGA